MALPFGGLFWSEFLNELRWILNHHELQWRADLGCGQTHAGGVPHRFTHRFDEILDARGMDLLQS